MLRSPWYNLDVCGLTNPMSAYLQKRQHSCAAILARFSQVSNCFCKFFLNHPKQNRRIKPSALVFLWESGPGGTEFFQSNAKPT